MLKDSKDYNLEDRLIDFSVRFIKTVELLPKSKVGSHKGGQLMRSGTSPAPNYGEAQDAESRADFVHKMKIALKELRETKVWLQMVVKASLISPASKLDSLISEADQLISIFVSSIKQQNKITEKRIKTNDDVTTYNLNHILQCNIGFIIFYSYFVIRHS
jgi:four helix bundle protein